MTIRSNPPGAQVYVDNEEIGTTPCSTGFVYYGTREIRLVKDGYETLKTKHAFHVPWYQYPVAEFFAENLVPGEIRDEHTLNFTLEPQIIVPPRNLIERGENLRRGVQAAAAVGVDPYFDPRTESLPVPTELPPGTELSPGAIPRGGQEILPGPAPSLAPLPNPEFQPTPAPVLPPGAGPQLFPPGDRGIPAPGSSLPRY
ncbi:MAG: PEGA domain-containing protein [Planctomycetales bacterium]|nr:PEGA domain-containing protein [Planctomycetales bacterium]